MGNKKHDTPIAPPKSGPKILVLDIETSPSLADVWSIWNVNVGLNQLRETGTVICWAAKYVGRKGVEFRSDHHDGHQEQVRRMWELMDEADILVHYNGRSFDVRHLNREFLMAGLNPPSPYKQIDLLTEVRRNFRFVSNKLDHVSGELEIGKKVQHEGHGLWTKCVVENDPKAWSRMRRYNVGDVRLTEDLYYKLLPWLKHPNVALYGDEATHSCPKCGGTALERRGFAYTTQGKYQQYKCNQCGGWSRGARRLDATLVKDAV